MRNILILLALITISCGRNANAKPASDSVPPSFIPVQVPDTIFDPIAKADYRLIHFWDNCDLLSTPVEVIDSVFPSFADVYQYASAEAIKQGTIDVLNRVSSNPNRYTHFGELARRHLYDKDSEAYSPQGFAAWARILAESKVLSDGERTRYKYLLEALEKNSPGSQASDFTFRDRNGGTRSLYSLPPTPYTLLVLYDPDCDTCHDLIARVQKHQQLTDMVRRGTVRMLLVDIADDEQAFRKDAASLPADWTVGIDCSGMEDNDLYIFDSTPAIYLLDSSRRVLLKEPTLDELIIYARSH